MALAYTDVQVEIREISLQNRPEELYEISKKGTVPVLITIDGLVIDESLKIMLWTLKSNLNRTWLTENHNKEIEMINRNDILFKKWLDKYKYHDRYLENSKEHYRKKCADILSEYENQLNKTKYFLRDSISIADVAIFPFIRQFANVDYQWFENNYNKLTSWLEEICLSNLFIEIMKKHEVWNNKNKSIIISS
jgi:glutathione S-transferase